MTKISYRTVNVDGLKIFYREGGLADASTLLLLHGFPTASHMFRDLIPLLADRFHIVAPDLPGFGQSDMPSRDTFPYTFAKLAEVIGPLHGGVGPEAVRNLHFRLRRACRPSDRASSIRSGSPRSSRKTATPMRRA